MNCKDYVVILLALEFAAFGWRINREINLDEEGRLTWFPIADIFNIISILAIVFVCILLLMFFQIPSRYEKIVIGTSFIFLVMYPINTANHYRIFSNEGRNKYLEEGEDYPWITDHEIISFLTTLILAMFFVIAALIMGG